MPFVCYTPTTASDPGSVPKVMSYDRGWTDNEAFAFDYNLELANAEATTLRNHGIDRIVIVQNRKDMVHLLKLRKNAARFD